MTTVPEPQWPEAFFRKHGKLYLRVLRSLIPRAKSEVDFLINLFNAESVPLGGRVLDLACGIGRHAVELAKRGFNVVGIDFSEAFIPEARRRAREAGVVNSAQFLLGDARQAHRVVRSAAKFDAVINLFTSLGYEDEADDLTMLRNARRLAKPTALLAVETQNRDAILRNFRPSIIEQVGDLEIRQRNRFNFEKSRVESVWSFYEIKGKNRKFRAELNVQVRSYSLHELIDIVRNAGWDYVAAYAGLTFEPFSPDHVRMLVTARAN